MLYRQYDRYYINLNGLELTLPAGTALKLTKHTPESNNFYIQLTYTRVQYRYTRSTSVMRAN